MNWNKKTRFAFLWAMLAWPLCGGAQPTSDPYTLSPDTAAAGIPFVLHVTIQNYNCNQRFFNQSIAQIGDSLLLSFSDTTLAILAPCAAIPYGPTFDMPALKAGKHPVFLEPIIYCPPGTVCPLGLVGSPVALIAPQLAGTLYVTGTTALRNDFVPENFSAALQAGVLALSLPRVPSAPWSVAIVSLSGRTLQSFRVEPQTGAVVRLPVKARPDNGLYLLRIAIPGEVPLTLRVLQIR